MENQSEKEIFLQSLNHLDVNTILILAAGYQFQSLEMEEIVKAKNPGQVFIELLKSKVFKCSEAEEIDNQTEWEKLQQSLNHLGVITILSLAAGYQFQPGEILQIAKANNPVQIFLTLFKSKGDFQTRMANYTYQRPLHLVRNYEIVLAGKTGCGKSSTANTILEREAFKADPSANSVTSESSYATSVNGDRTITVVDTPGVHDTVRPASVVKREIARTAFMLREGVHCFGICINASETRVTKETKTFLDQVEVNGHADFFDYCMLVYTKPESDLCDISLNEYVEKQKENADMKSFLEKIGHRMLAVNNKAEDPRETKRNKDAIIAMVDKVIEDNMIKKNSVVFTNDTFKKAKELREKVVEIVESQKCHPSLVNAVIEAVIWFSNWGTIAEKEFVEKVIHIICNSEQCKNDGTNLVFKNDKMTTTITVDTCKVQIKIIYKEIKANINVFYKVLGTILSNKKKYLLFGTAAAGTAGVVGLGGAAAVGVALGLPAVIALYMGNKYH